MIPIKRLTLKGALQSFIALIISCGFLVPAWGDDGVVQAAADRAVREWNLYGSDSEALRRNNLIKQPTTSDLMDRLQLALWAGQTGQARTVFCRLKDNKAARQSAEEIVNGYAVNLILNDWDGAKRFLEQFPEVVPAAEDRHEFVAHWAGAHPNKQLQEQIDSWIAAQGIKNPAWQAERSWFKKMADDDEAEKASIAAATARIAAATARLKQNPSDVSMFDNYMSMREEARLLSDSCMNRKSLEYYLPHESELLPQISETSLEWLSSTLRPDTACAAYQIGHRLENWPHIALLFLNNSLNMKFSGLDEKQLKSLPFSGDMLTPESDLRYRTKSDMVECYLAIKDKNHAHGLLIELAKSVPGHALYLVERAARLSPNDASTQKLLENITKTEDVKHANDSEYWLGRADAYRVVNNDAQTRESYERVLHLTENNKPAYYVCKGTCPRRRAITRYADYLIATGHRAEASDLLKKEYLKHPESKSY